jgi:hypothetical protein
MLGRRVKQLIIFYVTIIMLFATFGIYFNIDAKNYDTEEPAKDDILTGDDKILLSATNMVDTGFYVYYYDSNDNLYKQEHFSHGSYNADTYNKTTEDGNGNTLKSESFVTTDEPYLAIPDIDKPGYVGYKVTNVEYYYSRIKTLVLKEDYASVVEPPNETISSTANATYKATIPDSKTLKMDTSKLSYTWYNLSSKETNLDIKDLGNFTQTNDKYIYTGKAEVTLETETVTLQSNDQISFKVTTDNPNEYSYSFNIKDSNNLYIDDDKINIKKDASNNNIITLFQAGEYKIEFYVWATTEPYTTTISSLKATNYTNTKLTGTADTLEVSSTVNAKYYYDGAIFYCLISDGTINYKSNTATLAFKQDSVTPQPTPLSNTTITTNPPTITPLELIVFLIVMIGLATIVVRFYNKHIKSN